MSALNNDDACPFHVNLTLELLCAGADYSSFQVKIRHELKCATKDQAICVAFNESRYAFDFLRGQSACGSAKDPKKICEAMFGGLFELATLSLALTTVVVLSGGPETLAAGRMELTCGHFFRGGNKLL